MAKGKDGKKYTQAQLMALKSTVRTDLASKATIGSKSSTARMVDQSKLADPYKGAPKSQKAYNALNTAGKMAAETVALGAAGKAAKIAYKGTYVLGKKVVHGSPVQGLKSIKPTTGSAARPKESVNFSWNPKGFNTSQPQLANQAAEYAGKSGKPGSYYVGKIRRKDIVSQEPGVVVGKGPIKVTKEIKQTNSPLADAKSLNRSLRGPSNAKNKLVDLKKAKQRKIEYAKKNKNSVV
jgi:hypothetical protein